MPEAGQTLSHYRLIEKIGEGGMGVVWRAEDTKLRRDVALKFLPEGIAKDADRLARFEREARMLAALNDSNVATIHEMDHAEGEQFLVLEYVPGVSLAERLKKGPLPVQEALKICCDLARGLEAAHAKGMIHRDLKPANVQLTPEGKVKVLDFGLAKALGDVVAADERSQQMTVTAATGEYVVVGTVPYMSPEQAAAMPVDKRTDVWAFGCILYELLTGERAFAGETVSNTLTKIQGQDPEWEHLPTETPQGVARLLHRCLEKDVERRLHDVADARIEIEDCIAGRGRGALPLSDDVRAAPTRSTPYRVLPWLLIPLVAIVVWWLRPSSDRVDTAVSRMVVELPDGERLAANYRRGFALSPDGRTLAFVSGVIPHPIQKADTPTRIHVRRLAEWDARPLRDTEGARWLAFSPDGRWIAFSTKDNQLKKVPVDGGPTTILCECDASFGLAWGAGGDVLFAKETGGIQRVSASGGEPRTITRLREEAGETSHRLPRFLPDLDVFTYTSLRGGGGDPRIFVESDTTGERQVVVEDGWDARFVSTGHLLFARDGRLMAVPFDIDRLQPAGLAFPVIEDVSHALNLGTTFMRTGAAYLDVSVSGDMAYVRGSVGPDKITAFSWVDLEGSEERLDTQGKDFRNPRIAPDGRRVLFSGDDDVWLLDVDRGILRRQTFNGGGGARWGPGDDHLTFRSNRDGTSTFYWKPIDSGQGSAHRLGGAGEVGLYSGEWTPDGATYAYVAAATETGQDIWFVARGGDPEPFLNSEFNEGYPQFSPDGRWILYTSNESGRSEVYLRPYPEPGPRVQVSTGGSEGIVFEPVWSRDGTKIIYRDRMSLLSVAMTFDGDVAKPGTPREIMEWSYDWSRPSRMWDIGPDNRFLAGFGWTEEYEQKLLDLFFPTRIHVVLNWTDELNRKLAAAQ